MIMSYIRLRLCYLIASSMNA